LSELVAFFIGGFAGMLILGIFAVDSYQKGYEDGVRDGLDKDRV
jgi:ammonia channel protein AmtB